MFHPFTQLPSHRSPNHLAGSAGPDGSALPPVNIYINNRASIHRITGYTVCCVFSNFKTTWRVIKKVPGVIETVSWSLNMSLLVILVSSVAAEPSYMKSDHTVGVSVHLSYPGPYKYIIDKLVLYINYY